jgi:hypothetical protein
LISGLPEAPSRRVQGWIGVDVRAQGPEGSSARHAQPPASLGTSDFTAFMYLGRLVEYGATRDIFLQPHLKETEDFVTGRFG